MAAAPSTCSTPSTIALAIRAEGLTELVGDLVFTCTGTGSITPATVSVVLSLPVTSKALGNTGFSEALAVVGANSVSGVVAGNQVTFTGVPIPAAGGTVTVTNIRVNASAGSGNPLAVTEAIVVTGAQVATSGLPAQTVAVALSSVGSMVSGAVSDSVCSAVPPTSPAFLVNIQELISNAFKLRGGAANSTLGSALANNTETAFYVVNGAFTNQADAGTRMKILFSNIPANVTLYMPTSVSAVAGSVHGTLAMTATESGPFSAVAPLIPNSVNALSASPPLAAIPVSAGQAVTVYEITSTDAVAQETYQVPVYLASTAGVVLAGPPINSTVSFAPINTSNIPAFASTLSNTNAVRVFHYCLPVSSLPTGEVGASYVPYTLAPSGGTPPYSFASNTMPPGLSINSSGTIIGIPTSAGSYSPVVTVTDFANSQETFSLNMLVLPQVSILTTSLPGGSQGFSYSQTLLAGGGETPYSWSISAGSLTGTGLSLNTTSGVISGIPIASNTTSFTAQVMDALNGSRTQPLSIAISPRPVITGVTNAADSSNPPLASGSLAYVLGQNLASTLFTLPTTSGGVTAVIPTTTGGVTVTVNGLAAPVASVSPTQLVVQIPYAAGASGIASFIVSNNGVPSTSFPVSLAPQAPGIIQNAAHHAAVLNHDGTVNSSSVPAFGNTTASAFVTGIGAVNPLIGDGLAAPSANIASYAATNIPASVTIAGITIGAQFVGLAPGQSAGVGEVTFNAPPLANGDYPFTVTLGGRVSISANISIQTPVSFSGLDYAFDFASTNVSQEQNVTYSTASATPTNTPTLNSSLPGLRDSSGNWVFTSTFVFNQPGSGGGTITTTYTANTDAAFANVAGTYTVQASVTRTCQGTGICIGFGNGTANGTVTITITNGAPPAISQLSPNTAPVGSGAVNLLVHGHDFTQGSTISLTTPSGQVTSLAATFVGTNQMTATIPVSILTSAGIVEVTVVDSSGIQTNQLPFTISPSAVHVSSIVPRKVPAGSAATQITIAGQNFGQGAVVNWTDSSAQITPIAASLIAANQITATVPVELLTSAGPVQVSVTSGGNTSNPFRFNIQAAVTSVTPAGVPYGSGATPVSIAGAGTSFTLGSTVKWTSPGGAVTLINPSALVQAAQVAATLPASLLTTAGTAQIAIMDPSGSVSTQVPFNITSPISVTSVAPAAVLAGSGSTAIAVAGPAFTNGSSLTWTTPQGSPITISPDTIQAAQISATIPASLLTTAGTAQIAVANGGGVLSNQVPFRIQPFSITSLSLNTTAAENSVTLVTINGQNLTGAAGVVWTAPDGKTVMIAPVFLSPTQVVAAVPGPVLTDPGLASIALQDASGARSNALAFTINPLSPVSVTTTTVRGGTADGATAYSTLLAAAGGNTIGPYTWQFVGAPPGVVTLSSDGLLTGTTGAGGALAAGAAGTYNFTVQATDVDGNSALQNLTLTVAAPAPVGCGSCGGGGGSPPPSSISTWVVAPLTVVLSVPAGNQRSQSATLTFKTSASSSTTLAFASEATTDAGAGSWLSVVPASGTLTRVSSDGTGSTYTATVTVTADATGFVAGNSLQGSVSFTALATVGSLPVTMNITAAPKVNVSPQSLSFSYDQGGSIVPAPQSLSAFSQPSGGGFTVAASSSGWLSAGVGGASSGTTPASVSVSVDVSKVALCTGASVCTLTGTVTVSSGSSRTEVAVTLSVKVKSAPPQLTVAPSAESFTLTLGSAAVGGQVTVSNTGGGTLQFSVGSDQSWLTPGAASGSATSLSPASVGLTVDPSGLKAGIYSGHITIKDTGSSAQATVTITLVVSPAVPTIVLSQSGMTFTAIANGPQPPAQGFTIANQGQGSLNWAAQAQVNGNPGANWLSVTPSSGVSTAGEVGTGVTVSANQTGLAAGQYYGSINIAAGNAANSPQTITVLLNVTAAPQTSGGILSTGGITLGGTAGSTAPLTQQVNVFNPSNTPGTYSATTFTVTGSNWLSVSPASGALNPGETPFTVRADLSHLGSGIYYGTVTVAFGDGSVGAIQVVALALGSSGAAGSASLQPEALRPYASGCTPNAVVPNFNHPVAQSKAQVTVAQVVQVQIVDNCNNPVTRGNGGGAQITFSNKDTALNLQDVGGGIWEGTWTPANASNNVMLQVLATGSGPGISKPLVGGTQISMAVQAAPQNAAAQPQGVVNAAAALATPNIVVPGGYVAIYGTGMASDGTPTGTSIPLATLLNGTQLFLGGRALPLSYAGPTQVNGLIPQDLNPNAAFPLVVQRGDTQSVPIPVTVAGLQPGIYTQDQSGSGQGLIQIAGTALLAAPAGNGAQPAKRGTDYLAIYATGLGPVIGTKGEAAPVDGAAAQLPTIYLTTNTVTVAIGGVNAPVLFAGFTPTLVALYQVNVQVPVGAPTGDAVPIILTVTTPEGTVAQSLTVSVAIR
jgi:uncharacterized protein (TIGR03437 family)